MPIILTSRKHFDSEVFQQATEACDQIMTDMGAEIHDDLIQKISVLRLYMDRLESAVPFCKESEQIFINMRTDFDNVSNSIRRISRQLMPVKMENDSFMSSLEVLCQNMESSKAANIHFEHIGTEQKINAVKQTHVYRIIQELINNAFKHSSAWHIWVRIEWGANTLTVEVEDDGTAINNLNKFINMLKKKYNTLKMRSLLLGATIKYSTGQKGLLAKLELPISQ